MNRDKRGVLVGLVIGDGHLKREHSANSARLVMRHGAAQAGYLAVKSRRLAELLGGRVPKMQFIQNNGFSGVLATKTHRYFRVLRKWLYRGGRKAIVPAIRFLNDEGLAFWYMDDGGLGVKRRRGKVHAVDLYINCHSPLEEAMAICEEIKRKWDITFRPNLNNGSYRIRCGTLEARRFVAIVDRFICDEMRYKIAPLTAPTSARVLPHIVGST